MEFYAHKTDDNRVQLLKEHLENVSNLSYEFAKSFSEEEHAKIIGLYHDIGKYSLEFQNRLNGCEKKVDHSTAGALELYKSKDVEGSICISAHHGGLLNLGSNVSTEGDGTYIGRIKKGFNNNIPDYSNYEHEIAKPTDIKLKTKKDLDLFFETKFLFSCLVDADFLDTEEFVNGQNRSKFFNSMEDLLEKFNKYVENLDGTESELNKERTKIRNRCVKAAYESGNFYSLTVPTGGGKTISSMAYAINKAVNQRKDRIIYVIPYCSIIDQTVSVFEQIFGTNNILAHYSEYEFDDTDEVDKTKKLATENWDYPIIVTTSLQFFESIYSSKTSRSRKLHNIANSVIVFDEYQMIPVDYLNPCRCAIEQLMSHFNSTILLSTATQPGTSYYSVPCKEIVEDVDKLFEKLKRTEYEFKDIEIEQLAEEINKKRQVLCIVNTRNTAQELYALLEGENIFHLSTLMPPKLRKETIDLIRKRLKENSECKVISTSLIEAGVDVDFPYVYREENGIDSIIQAGGRCNREGKRELENTKVCVFSLKKPMPKAQRKNRDAMIETKFIYPNIYSPKAILKYFEILYELKGKQNLDIKNIMEMAKVMKFKSVSDAMKLIEDNTKIIYIPYDETSMMLIKKIEEGERTRELFRKLGPYGVGVYSKLYDSMIIGQSIIEYENFAVLKDMSLFDVKTGLKAHIEKEETGIFI